MRFTAVVKILREKSKTLIQEREFKEKSSSRMFDKKFFFYKVHYIGQYLCDQSSVSGQDETEI